MKTFLSKNSKIRISRNGGFSLVELLVTLTLSALFIGLTMVTFQTFSSYQSIDKDADVIVSYIKNAHDLTIDSKNDLQYGVKFASTTVTLFQGTSYSAGASTNLVYNISSKVTLSSISLTGNASSLYFYPITGKPNATGTVTYVLKNNASTTKVITIYGTGLAEAR